MMRNIDDNWNGDTHRGGDDLSESEAGGGHDRGNHASNSFGMNLFSGAAGRQNMQQLERFNGGRGQLEDGQAVISIREIELMLD